MSARSQLRSDLASAMTGVGGGLKAADRLCAACVRLLPVDGAAVSIITSGTTRGTFGSSSELSRRIDEFQFTFGEGPCLDAVAARGPIFATDLDDPHEQRWPAFTPAVLASGVRAVFAFPTTIATMYSGVLDLYRTTPGPLSPYATDGALWAAELAALPMLDLMSTETDWAAAAEGEGDGDSWSELGSLERVEVYQATGMIMSQLDLPPAEALARLRAHAFMSGRTASDVAWDIVERRLRLDSDDSSGSDDDGPTNSPRGLPGR
ncbi:GAF and ANTAR domain-containing protein [Gordonia sp. NPDC058843]|uniref:GAF and ANTAR domain-containing protein n=1 Tax=Gordonia sp. NPDC058843 TaxID=3346648 RepID=UPI0036D11864